MAITDNNENRLQFTDYLEDNGIPFVMEYTSRTYKIKSELGDMVFSTEEIGKRGMNFIQQVRHYVNKNDIASVIPNIDYTVLGLKRFIYTDKAKQGIHKGIIEFDLDKAYWKSALNIGVIDEAMYLKGIEKRLTKVELLASLGSLAKMKFRRVFDGKKYKRSVIIDDSSETRHIWDAISFEVDKCMLECAERLGQDFFFYWTDAIFFYDRPMNRELVQAVADMFGFSGKFIELKYIEGGEKSITAWTEKMKGNAKTPKRDADGNYGRHFTTEISFDKKTYVDLAKQIEQQYGRSLLKVHKEE